MAFIRCGAGGGSGSVEVITGTMTGAAGNTSAGQITVTSQQGKAPKSAVFYNSSKAENQVTGGTWTDGFGYIIARQQYSTNPVGFGRIGGTPSSVSTAITAVGANSISFACPTSAGYYTGTWVYRVEFE